MVMPDCNTDRICLAMSSSMAHFTMYPCQAVRTLRTWLSQPSGVSGWSVLWAFNYGLTVQSGAIPLDVTAVDGHFAVINPGWNHASAYRHTRAAEHTTDTLFLMAKSCCHHEEGIW